MVEVMWEISPHAGAQETNTYLATFDSVPTLSGTSRVANFDSCHVWRPLG